MDLDEFTRRCLARAVGAQLPVQQRRDADMGAMMAAFEAAHPELAQPAESVGERALREMTEAASDLERKWRADDERLAASRAAGRAAFERARRERGQAAGRGPAAAGSALAGARGSWLL